MTKEQIAIVFGRTQLASDVTEDWKVLFKYYNEVIVPDRPDIYKPLSMNCRPCYMKVYLAIKKHIAV